MIQKSANNLKKEVRDYWNDKPCGIYYRAKSDKKELSKADFDSIEDKRYSMEPEINSFAQFSRSHGLKVLEVGVGMGADFMQWIRSGAKAYGIDMTEEGINITNERLKMYGLKAEELKVADCESIPYPDNTFDIVYSWGVIHHTPDTIKALDEIIRVAKPGGKCKIMVYNRHSMSAFYLWFKKCFLRGKFYKSLSWAVANYMESPGTKAFTKKEIGEILAKRNINNPKIDAKAMSYDYLKYQNQPTFMLFLAAFLVRLFGSEDTGWFMMVQFEKV